MDVVSIVTTAIVFILFFWLVYNSPACVVGFLRWRTLQKQSKKQTNSSNPLDPPSDHQSKVSVVVAAKNEEVVIDRLLKGLANLDYANKEVIVVEDGSTDSTPQICQKWAESHPSFIKYHHIGETNGKPQAINYGASKATGDIIAVYDADAIVEKDVLTRIVPYFGDPEVAAIQGELETINPDENVTTKLTVLSDFINNLQQLGKDRLNGFVLMSGTNQYIRRSVLEEIGYWDQNALSEDVEISVRLARKGYKIKYVPVKTGGEAPAKLKSFIRQRAKWIRGHTQAAMKHKGLMRKPSWRIFDAQMTLLFPLMLIIGLIGYIMTILGVVNYGVSQVTGSTVLQVIGIILLLLNLMVPAMIAASKPSKVVYIPLLYVDWILFAVISVYVHIRALLRRPEKWTRTPKSGKITIPLRVSNAEPRSD
jgi:cellulose synthase/poly-beta-1,6-N-acetylglucosamine synthase-like glycosyltransferase